MLQSLQGLSARGVKANANRILRDLAHLDAKLAKIESSGDFVTNLIYLVKKKQVEKPAPAPAPASSKPIGPAPPPPQQAEPQTSATAPADQPGAAPVPDSDPAPTSSKAEKAKEMEGHETTEAVSTAPESVESTPDESQANGIRKSLETSETPDTDSRAHDAAAEPTSTAAEVAASSPTDLPDRPKDGEGETS